VANRIVQRKTTLARRMLAGDCGGGYTDAILVLSSLLSSLASELWPGEFIDRKRFVELWVRYALPAASRVSVPLLAQTLYSQGAQASIVELKKLRPEVFVMFPEHPDSLVLSGDRADLSETEVAKGCPSLSLKIIREHSYPNAFYQNVRNPAVHRYGVGDYASVFPGGTRNHTIGYANVMEKPYRRIYFNIEWLCKLAEQVVTSAASHLESAPFAEPYAWWLPVK
jgi:hypothetical protein